MVVESELIEMVRLKLNASNFSTAQQSLLSNLVSEACEELIGNNFYSVFLRTKYLVSDTNGQFVMEEAVIPFQCYYGGNKDSDHSWRRLTPIKTDLGLQTLSRSRGNARNFRYTIIPSEKPNQTTFKLVDTPTSINIKLIYLPKKVDVSEFPDYALGVLSDMVVLRYQTFVGTSGENKVFELLRSQLKTSKPRIQNSFGKIEYSPNLRTTKNKKFQGWMMAEPDFTTLR